jgi:glucokinase
LLISKTLPSVKEGRDAMSLRGAPKQLKSMNKMRVLRCIQENSPISNPRQVSGMGISVPGITQNGVVLEAPSLNWSRYPLLTEAEKYFSFPVYIENDVNVAVLGEQWIGCAKNKRNILLISVGSGIGSGIIINNQLYRGHSNAAGGIGYMVTENNGHLHEDKPTFRRHGYLESVAGGKSIGHKLTALVLKDPEHPAYEDAKICELSGDTAFKLAESGDPTALSVVNDAIDHLGYGIINAASLLNPEIIILGGSILKSSDYILPRLRKMVDQYLPSSVEMKISQLGESVGVLGAVSLTLREQEMMINH